MFETLQAKTKLASLALAVFIALAINGTIVWEFDQVASKSSERAAFIVPTNAASSFEI